ncbi:hypothetical protein LB518_14315 [Mesorhizobium sp. BR1-1-16]|uniref:hypothetical protein n=1 Tax=Mesorhizobium sp. BR1-1-16 TaxID=2876653 RepID=UPI001CC8F1BC|nr:hypothetical protein [Mesorhizobium sp. BR1-1-16]MBZ9937475.1 hypothetical protein [Mesorhizobium sp. BR1-1-16]
MRFGLWLSIGVLLIVPAQADMPAGLRIMPRVYQEEFHLRSSGPPVVKGWMQEDPEAAAMLAAAGCQSLGFSCADEEGDAGDVIRYVRPSVVSERYRGTALPVHLRGDRTYAKFLAPPGFVTCRAGIFLKDGAISPGATFAGSIQRSGRDGLAVYADLGDGDEPRFIEFKLLIQYVAAAGAERRTCWPDLTLVFLCRSSGCRASPAYPETDLR